MQTEPQTKGVEFIETFSYVIKSKQGKNNMVADMLPKRYDLFTSKFLNYIEMTKISELFMHLVLKKKKKINK